MRPLIPFALVAAAVCAIATPVRAQTPRSERPYRGLFASGADSAAQSLIATGTFGGGWDTSLLPGEDDPTPPLPGAPRSLRGAGNSSVAGTLEYSSYRERLSVGASVATSGRYYPQLANPYLASHSARVGFDYRASRSTTVRAGQALEYQPFGSLNLFPGLTSSTLQGTNDVPIASAPSLDMRALSADYYTSSTDAHVAKQLSARSSLSADYAFIRTKFGEDFGTFQAQSVAGRYIRLVSPNLAVRLGYGHTSGHFAGSTESFRYHIIDSGVDYRRVFAPSRRTTVAFDTSGTAVSNGGATRFTVLGGAQLVHEIGRSWALSSTYRRNVQFLATLNQPLFSDGVTATLNGLVSNRVEFTSGLGASTGSLGFVANANNLWSYYGTASINAALSRNLAVGSSYNYYHYALDGGIYGQLGFPDELNRHSVSVFLRAWAPLFQKGRRINASR